MGLQVALPIRVLVRCGVIGETSAVGWLQSGRGGLRSLDYTGVMLLYQQRTSTQALEGEDPASDSEANNAGAL